ncbi:hypothetical protein BTO07_15790 [Polaribacter sp. SA4-12]|nr:hypothetical protein BTO07_15790 [Polaribacter sp. SA4-12]
MPSTIDAENLIIGVKILLFLDKENTQVSVINSYITSTDSSVEIESKTDKSNGHIIFIILEMHIFSKLQIKKVYLQL